MKKILICITSLLICFALAGCGEDGGELTLNNLGSQLDQTSNIISSVQTINPSDINLTKDMLETIANNENSVAIYNNMIGTQQTLLNEEYYKTNILSQTAKLKNNIAKNLKLSKTQATAIKELTNNLEKYSNSVAYTQNDMSSTLRQISTLKKNAEKNADKINAKLNRLACNSNARSSYYENIIFTLSQIETYLNVPQNEQTNQSNQNIETSQNEDQTNLCPNCNIPAQGEKCQNCGFEFCQNCENAQTEENDTDKTKQDSNLPKEENLKNNPYAKFNSNNFNRANFAYPYNRYSAGMYGYMPYGAYGAYGNGGFGMNGMGGYYGMPFCPFGYGNEIGSPYAANGRMNGNNINFARFNPNRNTDTYAPLMRNIDTYRAGTQANIQPVNNPTENEKPKDENQINSSTKITNENKPEQRLENFEEVMDDNTIQKIDEETDKKVKEDETLMATSAAAKAEKQDPEVVAY